MNLFTPSPPTLTEPPTRLQSGVVGAHWKLHGADEIRQVSMATGLGGHDDERIRFQGFDLTGLAEKVRGVCLVKPQGDAFIANGPFTYGWNRKLKCTYMCKQIILIMSEMKYDIQTGSLNILMCNKMNKRRCVTNKRPRHQGCNDSPIHRQIVFATVRYGCIESRPKKLQFRSRGVDNILTLGRRTLRG